MKLSSNDREIVIRMTLVLGRDIHENNMINREVEDVENGVELIDL